jgi:hypothetical protein
MMLQRSKAVRAAGLAAIGTVASLVGSGVAFWLFLNGDGAVFGPINDVLVAVSLALLAVIVFGMHALVGDRRGRWFGALSLLAIAGIVLAIVGQLLLVAGAIRLETSFVTGGFGILPVLGWVVAIAAIALGTDALPVRVGWITLIALPLTAALALGTGLPASVVLVLSIALLTALVAWLASIAWTCLVWAPRTALAADDRAPAGSLSAA